MRTSARYVLVAMIGFLLGSQGCGGDGVASDQEEVERVAQAYVDAVTQGDAASACQYLPERPGCVEQVTDEIRDRVTLGEDFGKVKSVRIEGRIGRANFSGGAFLVLSKSEDGWVTGAPSSEAKEVGAPGPPSDPTLSVVRRCGTIRAVGKTIAVDITEGKPIACSEARQVMIMFLARPTSSTETRDLQVGQTRWHCYVGRADRVGWDYHCNYLAKGSAGFVDVGAGRRF